MAYKDYEHILNMFPKSIPIYKHVKENWEFVDTIDFTPYLKDNIDVADIMTAVQNDNMNNNLPEYCQNYVFNWITVYEFASYLTNRYGDEYMSDEREEIHYYLLKKYIT